jgi:RNA-directed DNA polymerase
VPQFEAQEQAELAQLRNQRYRRQPARRVWIPKPGTPEQRPLGIPAVRDRTVEAALKNVLEPIFERDFAEQSYGFRPGRGCREAVQRVEELLREGRAWCVDVDFKSYFDTIPHERLIELVRQRIVDGKVLALLEQSLKAGVLEELKAWQPTEWGTPQGAVISPILANLYLNPLDHQMAQRGWEMVRYADDLVVLCRSKEEAQQVLDALRQWSEQAGLTVHPTKTRIVNVPSEGFDFLGWHGSFRESYRTGLSGPDGWLRRRLRAMLRKRERRPSYGLSQADSRQWPNRWFAERGLFSLEHGSRAYG